MNLKFLALLKKYQESNLQLSVDPKFRKVHDKFKSHPSEKTYNKLILYLRHFSDENKLNISKRAVLLYADDNNQPVFNSSLKDDDSGNCFRNYLEKKIKFIDKYQKKSVIKSNKEIINVTVITKKLCDEYSYNLYVSNYIGSV